MKTHYLLHVTLILSVLLFLSCTNASSGGVEEPSIVKENKEVLQPKTKKKTNTKTKKKPNLVSKKKKKIAAIPVIAKKDKKKKEAKTTITTPSSPASANVFATKLNNYAIQNDYATKYGFLIDMSLPSGQNRFFVYDMAQKKIVYAALVAHGSCNETFRSRPKFSNAMNTGCSSVGKYKIGEAYHGKYGKSYRLYGLDKGNSMAFKRGIVIHAYDCVPEKEIYPQVLCNSLGCPMVSPGFFKKLSGIIGNSKKPILLWIYG